MVLKIRPSTSLDSLKSRITGGRDRREQLRWSDDRRRYLEKVARMVSKQKVGVTIHDGGAMCTPETGNERVEIKIFIPGDVHEQPATDLPPMAWDLLFQETELIHELGHVLYTDWDALDHFLHQVDQTYQQLFRGLVNAAEDGAIETQLAGDFNVREDLIVKNANLAKLATKTRSNSWMGGGAPAGATYNLRESIEIGLLDMGFYDSGRFDAILDENDTTHQVQDEDRVLPILERIQPHMACCMADVLSESDGWERVRRVHEFWEVIKPILGGTANQAAAEQSDEPRSDDMDTDVRNGSESADELPDQEQAVQQVKQSSASGAEDQDEDEAEEGDGSGGSSQDDSEEADEEGDGDGTGDAGEETDESADEEEDGSDSGSASGKPTDGDDAPEEDEGVRTDDSNPTSGQENEHDSPESNTDGVEDDDQSGSSSDDDQDAEQSAGSHPDSQGDGAGGSEDDVDDAVEDVKEDYQREVERQRDDDPDEETPEEREAEAFHRVVSGGSATARTITMLEEGEYESYFDRDEWENAKRIGNSLAEDLRRQLQRVREDEDVYGQRSGRLDTQRLHQVPAGNGRVFAQERTGEEREYSCAIVIDRSGSMDWNHSSVANGRTIMQAAEAAALQFARGLDQVGVETMIMGMFRDRPFVEKPLGTDLDRYVSNVANNRTGGSTPLSGTVEVARERLEQDAEHDPFIVVITDGLPDDTDRYEKVLDDTDMPVLGVYISRPDMEDDKFDHHKYFDRVVYAGIENVSKKTRQLAQEMVVD